MRALILRKYKRAPTTATGIIQISIHAKEDENTNSITTAAISCRTVTNAVGISQQMNSVITLMSSSIRLAISALWNLSLPVQVLRRAFSKTSERILFFACIVILPS